MINSQVDLQILEQNPWWGDPAAISEDRYLQRLRTAAFRWRPPVLDAMVLHPGAVHTLRGPRQVGKSTTAKLLIERLLKAGERRVLYFSFDLVRHDTAIVDVIRRARQLHPKPDGPWYLFLDEVTTVPEWQRAVKYTIDAGLAAGDFLFCTGSSARQMGTETLPGRRGDGRDYLQLPVSFRDFCTLVAGIPLPADAIPLGALLTAEGMQLAREVNLQGAALRRTLAAYRDVGGFPAAVTDYLVTGQVSSRTVEMLWAMAAEDVRRAGRDTVGTLKLLERISRSLGSTLSWDAMAEAMDAANAVTARDYVTLLAQSFLLLPVYFWDMADNTLKPQKQRKVYFIDPLFDAVAAQLLPGARRAAVPALVENLVAIGLYRSATDRLVQAAPAPGSVGVWRSTRGTELDFVVAEKAPGLTGPRLPVEVKGDNPTGISNSRKSIRRVFGRGIIATDTLFQPDALIPAIPVAVLLALLRERPTRVATLP